MKSKIWAAGERWRGDSISWKTYIYRRRLSCLQTAKWRAKMGNQRLKINSICLARRRGAGAASFAASLRA